MVLPPRVHFSFLFFEGKMCPLSWRAPGLFLNGKGAPFSDAPPRDSSRLYASALSFSLYAPALSVSLRFLRVSAFSAVPRPLREPRAFISP